MTRRVDEEVIFITIEELADFMNCARLGADWVLLPHGPELWQSTFRWVGSDEVYRPIEPYEFVDLYTYDGEVVWAGDGDDPTEGRGYRLSELFLEWKAHRNGAAFPETASR